MNPLIVLALVLIAAAVGLVLWNPYFYFFGGTINAQLLVMLVAIPLVLGLLVGFWLGWSRGRRSIKPKA